MASVSLFPRRFPGAFFWQIEPIYVLVSVVKTEFVRAVRRARGPYTQVPASQPVDAPGHHDIELALGGIAAQRIEVGTLVTALSAEMPWSR